MLRRHIISTGIFPEIKIFKELLHTSLRVLPDFSELLNGNESNLVLKKHFNSTQKYFLFLHYGLAVFSQNIRNIFLPLILVI